MLIYRFPQNSTKVELHKSLLLKRGKLKLHNRFHRIANQWKGLRLNHVLISKVEN